VLCGGVLHAAVVHSAVVHTAGHVHDCVMYTGDLVAMKFGMIWREIKRQCLVLCLYVVGSCMVDEEMKSGGGADAKREADVALNSNSANPPENPEHG